MAAIGLEVVMVRLKAIKLDVLVNLAILATCVVASVLMFQRYRAERSPSQDLQPFKLGAQIDNVSRGAYAASPYTLLMFVRSSCHFCTASMPFYKGLTVPEPPLNKLQFVVADSEPAEMARNYLAAHQVKVNDITPGSPDVPTPTLILVDKSGVIKAFWVGQLNDSGEREVKATLARLTM
jgi:hypothetical protein